MNEAIFILSIPLALAAYAVLIMLAVGSVLTMFYWVGPLIRKFLEPLLWLKSKQ